MAPFPKDFRPFYDSPLSRSFPPPYMLYLLSSFSFSAGRDTFHFLLGGSQLLLAVHSPPPRNYFLARPVFSTPLHHFGSTTEVFLFFLPFSGPESVCFPEAFVRGTWRLKYFLDSLVKFNSGFASYIPVMLSVFSASCQVCPRFPLPTKGLGRSILASSQHVFFISAPPPQTPFLFSLGVSLIYLRD